MFLSFALDLCCFKADGRGCAETLYDFFDRDLVPIEVAELCRNNQRTAGFAEGFCAPFTAPLRSGTGSLSI
jgi:hypothetical protein